MSDYDVIIVGAGLSGLTAAFALRKQNKNLNILLLEAKDRVGGRTLTEDMRISSLDASKKAKWDMGGQWVTDTQTNITRFLKELNIDTYAQYDTGKKVLVANKSIVCYNSSIPNISPLSLIDLQLLMNKCNAVANRLSSTVDLFDDELDKQTLAQFIFSRSFNATSRSILSTALRAIFGFEPTQINANYGALYTKSCLSVEALSLANKDCAQEKRIKGGSQQISWKLLDKLEQQGNFKIIFNNALIEINQQSDKTTCVKTINTKNDQVTVYSAKYKVICSLPPNQYTRVKFEPELPFTKRHVFSNFKMGNYIKCVITYDKAFWRDNGYSGEVVSDGTMLVNSISNIAAINVVYDGTDYLGNAALVGFIAANSALAWMDKSSEERRQTVIDEMVMYFGNEARSYVEYAEKLWNNEPYTGGCPTGVIVSSEVMGDYARATREPFGNVHFCGTESATQWMGYMDGAVESGERAANEVLHCVDKSNAVYEKTFYYQAEILKKSNKKQKSSITSKYLIQILLVALIAYGIYNKFFSN